jgi:hypothetical protein
MNRHSGVRDALVWEESLTEQRNDQPKSARQEQVNSDGAAPKSAAQQSNAEQNKANPNRTIVVHSTADDGPGSLREALAIASDGDKINIVVEGTITLTSGELVVNKSVTIRGPGKTHGSLSGNGASRVFHIMPGATVTLSSLTITNGNAGTSGFPANAGGGIFNDHAQLTLRDCIVSGNTARRYGGGVFSNSSGGGSASLTLVNTTVSGNAAEFITITGNVLRGYGGGILSGGGFLSADPSGNASLTLENSTVSGNRAGFGGGIFNDGFSGNATTTINNSSVSNNTAKWPQDRDDPILSGGGGIYNNGDSGVATVTVAGSTVSGNISGEFFQGEEFVLTPGNGGGIYNDGLGTIRPGNAMVTLTNTNVIGNQARSNDDGGAGGGIINEARDLGTAVVTVTASNINDNWADQYGSGVFNSSGSAQATVTVTGGEINRSNKQAIANFGGQSLSNPDVAGQANVNLTNTAIRENSTEGVENSTEAVLNIGATLQVKNCDISDNHATGIATGSPGGRAVVCHRFG